MTKPPPLSLDACRTCEQHLPLGPRPIVRAGIASRILIVGQAPSASVHASGIPWNDASGERLRGWLGVDAASFHDESKFSIIPMGFCYPGTGKSGDLAPRPECAAHWRQTLLEQLTEVRLTLVIGQYALAYHLPQRPATLTDTVKAWREYFPAVLPLPHPSPRNNIWLRRNTWFEEDVVPALRQRVQQVLKA